MSKEAVRVYGGVTVPVIASNKELEFYEEHPAVEYFCPGKVNEEICGAQMVLAKGYEDCRGRKVPPHFVAKGSAPHILGCPNMQPSKHQIGQLIRDAKKLDLDLILDSISKIQLEKGGPSADGPRKGDGDKGNENNENEELFLPEFVERKALNVDQVYTVLSALDDEEVTANGLERKKLIADYRTIKAIRNKEYILNRSALVIIGKCINENIWREFYNYKGMFTLTGQDPYISHNGKYVYYVVSFSNNIKKEDKINLLHSIKDNIWMALSSWQLIENKNEVIYKTTITNKKQIKIYKKLEKEKNLRKHYQDKR